MQMTVEEDRRADMDGRKAAAAVAGAVESASRLPKVCIASVSSLFGIINHYCSNLMAAAKPLKAPNSNHKAPNVEPLVQLALRASRWHDGGPRPFQGEAKESNNRP